MHLNYVDQLINLIGFMVNALGRLRKIQIEQMQDMPNEACKILDEVDNYFEKHGADLDE